VTRPGSGAAAEPVAITAGVVANRRLSTTMRRLTLAVPDDWGPPRPGQFVSIALERPGPDGRPGDAGFARLRRPFSVAGFAAERGRRRIELLYAPVGGVTERLAAFTAGAECDLLGPLGTGWPPEVDGHPLLVAGGRGIAPLFFYAVARARCGLPFTLLYGARRGDELIELPELPADSLREAAEDGVRGEKGTACGLLESEGARRDGPVMACGPHGMLATVADWARRRGRRCWVSVEAVFACGMGLCGGCAVPARGGGNRWVCRDGPVMDAESLDWTR
jgi:dihydroorotate dehydrogenase electron transfer subunit